MDDQAGIKALETSAAQGSTTTTTTTTTTTAGDENEEEEDGFIGRSDSVVAPLPGEEHHHPGMLP